MAYRYEQAAKLEGKEWVGSHECVALVQHYAGLPTTMHWKMGTSVKGNMALPARTAIATFKERRYQNRRTGNHAAFYLGQEQFGIWVIEQFRRVPKGLIRKRFIAFRGGQGNPSDDGDAYSVIE
ncbi:BPSL0067 family protein [Massilia sp. NR 4-1]|uniref:BPSL0067 family protein n=1 Tax=Massilia sp. NR 4-1 TaxID=1678028 RepID=UPI0006A2DD70|nr:BPSL0067 family protein [Massilia sp. NR 4-1]AKU23472.1 hypothetical protein ACZ75_20445 [Massilia sp. NR 4-1]